MQSGTRDQVRCESTLKKASRTHSKAHNLRMLLQVISDRGSISRADLARATGLTRASVSTLMSELMANRWVTEAGPGESAGGKRPTLLELDRTSRDIIVMDLSTRPLSGVIVDVTGTPRFDPIPIPSDPEETGADGVAAAIRTLTGRLLDRSDSEVLGIGVACPGVIDHTGRVVESIPLGWRNFELADCIRSVTSEAPVTAGSTTERRGSLPVQIINDSQAVALAIHRRQSSESPDRPVNDLMAMRVAFGVGAGIVLGGRLHLGPHRAAGEVAPLIKALMGRPITDPLDVDENDAVLATPELGAAIGSTAGHLANVFDISTVFVAVPSGGLDSPFEEAARAAADDAVLSALRPELQVTAVADDGLARQGAAAYMLQTETGLVAG